MYILAASGIRHMQLRHNQSANRDTVKAVVETGLTRLEKAISINTFEQIRATYYQKGNDGQCQVCFLGAVGLNSGRMYIKNGDMVNTEGERPNYDNVLIEVGIPIQFVVREYKVKNFRGSLGQIAVYLNDVEERKFRYTLKTIKNLVMAKVESMKKDQRIPLSYMAE